MECYKVESEFIDSLDFLSPPVKRIHNSRDVFVRPIYNTAGNDSQVLKRHRNTLDKNNEKIIAPERSVKICAESSTSLILKKTSERKILNRYSIVSYTSLHSSNSNKQPKNYKKYQDSKSKPLIKVTVIPKSDQSQTAKLLRKRRHTPKRVQSTISNQENSIQTKNVYLVVAGRKRDKIYEIKTTGSATFCSDQTEKNDNISATALTNVKQLIQSLNMDQEKLNDEKETKNNERCTFINCGNDPCRKYKEFISPHTSTSKAPKRATNRSRLRIYGQLGVTDDDRYVLRYGAVVSDKPVSTLTDFASDSLPAAAPVTRAIATRDDSLQLRKETSVQASYEENCECPKPALPSFPFGASQGTQVNFNVHVSTRKRNGHAHVQTIQRHTQCSCHDILEGKNEDKSVKDCQSPLVIISVYPKSSPEDNTSKSPKIVHECKRTISPPKYKSTSPERGPRMKVDKRADRRMDSKINNKRDTSKQKNESTTMDTRRVATSRAQSPIKMISQNPKKNIDEYKSLNIIKNKILEKDKHKTVTGTVPKHNESKSHRVNKKILSALQSSRPHFNEAAANTNYGKAKNNLVDNYTKKMTDPWKNSNVRPAVSANSKVRINIDGAHEYYKVLLGQDKLTTDLRITKTMKDTTFNKRCGPSVDSSGNMFVTPDKETTILPMSFELCKTSDNTPISERISGITIRDSLEISHRRGDKSFCNMKTTQTCYTAHYDENNAHDTGYLAPIKHYIGDDCSICDPIERDKEIRALLGVNQAKAHSSDGDRLYSCFYRRQWAKNNVAQINFVNLCPCLHTTKTEDTENALCIPEGCPDKCCPEAPCRISQLTTYENPPNSVQQADIDATNISTFTPCPNVMATEQQFLQQQELMKEQILLQQQQQQQQQLHLHRQQQLRMQPDYKAGCGGCCTTNHESQPTYIDTVKNDETDCCCDTVRGNAESSALYQQLILNRNIQVFLQVEQFSKQKPIVLSREQYDRVKRTIQSTIQSNRDKRKKIAGNGNTSKVSVGEVRKKTNIMLRQCCDQEVQTESKPYNKPTGGQGTKKNRRKTKSNYLSNKLKHSKPDRRCDRHYEDDSTIVEESSPHRKRQHYQQSEDYNSPPGYSTTDDDHGRQDEHNKTNIEHHKEINRCKRSKERYDPRVECHNIPAVGYRPTTRPPSKSGEEYKLYEDRPRKSEIPYRSNVEHQTMTDCPNIYKPSVLLPERNRENINLQQILGEYRKVYRDSDNLNIEQKYNTEQPYKGNIPYHANEYRGLHTINPGSYKAYDENVNNARFERQRLEEANNVGLGTVNDALERHHRVSRTCEKPLGAGKDFSAHPTHVEYNEQQLGQSAELRDSTKQGSHCDFAQKQSTDLNLVGKTKNSIQLEYRCGVGEKKSAMLLYNALNNEDGRPISKRKTLPSMEIHYTSMAYMKHLDISKSDLAVLSDSSLAHVQSFQTIFRGHRKSPTPNLGTSVYSLNSEPELRSEKSTTFIMSPKDQKPAKRPFLRRLMSCLVMRSRASEFKMPTTQIQELPSVNSSIDSYHISTSLGAMEVSSSIYDTSASFYSNHTILPINSKIKRGFFSSVRGFLTNRKS